MMGSFGLMVKWRKAPVMLRPPAYRILFSGQVQPAYICLPSTSGQDGRSCTCDLLVPNPDTSGLLTIPPEIGCQGWTRTNTERLNPDSESGLLFHHLAIILALPAGFSPA